MTLKFKTSPEAIRRANSNLVLKGVDFSTREKYTGIITAKTVFNGSVKIREISKDKINEAYAKSLKQYAEKL
ncbi:hypothetical protein [Chitinophaga alhagiae]|uniref:hypothetical protein n=1 Tax=Chitinophaga alhagiae TaxID=2203219 RepID=UPI000E5A5F5D|nr:hypothetical protein [Chitinophaga alhagiae]